jgi:hypothetical protein
VDLSGLTRPMTIKTKRATEEQPLVIKWGVSEPWIGHVDAPKMRIDVMDVPGDGAFLVFTGEKWAGEYHNFSESINITHGQLNIHISNEKDERGAFLWQPPHVQLEGDGDYYIDEVKSVSVLSKGQHVDGVFGGDADGGPRDCHCSSGVLAMLGICLYYCTRPTQTPMVASVTQREKVIKKEGQLEGS